VSSQPRFAVLCSASPLAQALRVLARACWQVLVVRENRPLLATRAPSTRL